MQRDRKKEMMKCVWHARKPSLSTRVINRNNQYRGTEKMVGGRGRACDVPLWEKFIVVEGGCS